MRGKWCRFLKRFITVNGKSIIIVCGLMVAQIVKYLLSIIQMMIPTVMIDWLLPQFSIKKLVLWVIDGLIVYLTIQILEGTFSGYLYFKYEILLTEQKIEKMIGQVMDKKVYEVEKYSEGYLMNLVFHDTVNVVSISVQMLVRIPATCICIFGTLWLLWKIAPILCVVQLFLIPLYVVAMFIFQKKMEVAQAAQRARKDELDSGILNILSHKKAVKLAKRDGFFMNYIISKYSKYIHFILKYWRIYFCAEQVPIIVVKIGNMAMLVCGIWLYMNNKLSLGMLVWVGTIGSLISEQLKDLCTRFLRRMANSASYDRVDEFDEQETKVETAKYNDKENKIEISDMDIIIDKKKLYHIPRFEIMQKGIILIEGANGSGKSTLLNWLLELIPKDIGKVEVQNVTLPADMFERTSYLSSPDILIEGTVLDNILLGSEKNARTDSLLEMLGIDFADKKVVTRPINLSFGEQQKIFLARVLNRNFEYLILDEPMTNLDIITKQRLIGYLTKLAKEKFIVLIGHEQGLEDISSRIYKIEDGELMCMK